MLHGEGLDFVIQHTGIFVLQNFVPDIVLADGMVFFSSTNSNSSFIGTS